jgi:hypothetical protein
MFQNKNCLLKGKTRRCLQGNSNPTFTQLGVQWSFHKCCFRSYRPCYQEPVSLRKINEHHHRSKYTVIHLLHMLIKIPTKNRPITTLNDNWTAKSNKRVRETTEKGPLIGTVLALQTNASVLSETFSIIRARSL